jgi:ureidoglycolate lyase
MSTTATLRVKPLTLEGFQPYGTFAPLTPPTARPLVAGELISFWPDCGGVLDLGPTASNHLAIGICQVAWRPLQIDVSEIHSTTGEGICPLDGNIYVHVAAPTPGADVPVEALEVFFVPQGTMLVLKPGVWHHAPHAATPGQTVNTLILLPQRAYANDCVAVEIAPVAFEA